MARADPGRDRHRQGRGRRAPRTAAGRAAASRSWRSTAGAVPATDRERALRPRTRRVHRRGRARRGVFEQADGGTLVSRRDRRAAARAPAELLRVLETREMRRRRRRSRRRVDVRVVAATHRDLRARSTSGRFREDLYFRLARRRSTSRRCASGREDIAPLAQQVPASASSRARQAPSCRARGAGALCRATPGPATSASCATWSRPRQPAARQPSARASSSALSAALVRPLGRARAPISCAAPSNSTAATWQRPRAPSEYRAARCAIG